MQPTAVDELALYFSNYNMALGVGTTDVLLINDGSGHFSDQTEARLGDFANVAFGPDAEIADLDGDGDNDILKLSVLYTALPFFIDWNGILYNSPLGFFDVRPFQQLPSDEVYMTEIGDLNGDGRLDIVQVGDRQDRVLLATAASPDTDVSYAIAHLDPSPRTENFGGNTALGDILGSRTTRHTLSALKRQRCPRTYSLDARLEKQKRFEKEATPGERETLERLISDYETDFNSPVPSHDRIQ